ncbi:hypothetical protein DY245_06555 [Streptomyces inhibens]|uniref:Uncharacterized protein n=1 Tax=Streptomyces inhibens TaxID=2293571 RepID=A0A371Q8W5_STRIH|nr:hypothetical protein DY245_06555 [Streptomyces inhibens]
MTTPELDDYQWEPVTTARVHDYLSGGTDNYAADRELAHQLLQTAPWLRIMVRINTTCPNGHVRRVCGDFRVRIRRGGRGERSGGAHGLPRRHLPGLERRWHVYRRGRRAHLCRVRAYPPRAGRPARRRCLPRPAPHHAGALGQDPAPRRPQRLLLPGVDGGLLQAGQGGRAALAAAQHVPELPQRPAIHDPRPPAANSTGPGPVRTGHAADGPRGTTPASGHRPG